jgi:hypothetical protein
MKILLLLVLVIPFMVIPTMQIDVYVFHSGACGSCVPMTEFLEEAAEKYPSMVLHLYDITEEENKNLYDLFVEVYNLDVKGYPTPLVFIGKDHFIGYDAPNKTLIGLKLDNCLKEGCTISLTQEKDCIVIIDSTPTPELPVAKFLIPFLVIAAIFCCLNPYTAKMIPTRTGGAALFFVAYFATSLLLCCALANAVSLAEMVIFLRTPLAVVAVLVGVLSMISVKMKILRIPESFQNAMDKMAAETSGFSLFSLGIGVCLLSLVYTCGIYLLVVYRMMFFNLAERLLNFAIFNICLIMVMVFMYFLEPERRTIFYIVVGIGSITLGVLSVVIW